MPCLVEVANHWVLVVVEAFPLVDQMVQTAELPLA